MLRAGNSHKSSGYTLIELLVVLGIASLLLSALPGAYRSAFPAAQLRAAVAELSAALTTSRASALGSQEQKAVWIENGTLLTGSKETRELFRPDGGLELSFAPFQATREAEEKESLVFFEDGTATGGTFLLSLDSSRSRVSVDWLTGSIEVQ